MTRILLIKASTNPGTILFRGLRWTAIRSRRRPIASANFPCGVSLGQRRLARHAPRNLRAPASLRVSRRWPRFSLSRRLVLNGVLAAGRLRNGRLPSSARIARRYGRARFGPLVSLLSGSPAVCQSGKDSWSARLIELNGRRARRSRRPRCAVRQYAPPAFLRA